MSEHKYKAFGRIEAVKTIKFVVDDKEETVTEGDQGTVNAVAQNNLVTTWDKDEKKTEVLLSKNDVRPVLVESEEEPKEKPEPYNSEKNRSLGEPPPGVDPETVNDPPPFLQEK